MAISPDNEAFTVSYSAYTAQVGKGAKPIDARKNCQLTVNVRVPSGYTYAIASVDYRGYAKLERGASALERARYYFQGMRTTTYAEHRFFGPMEDNWQTRDQASLSSMVYAPCGATRYLNINTELRVNPGISDIRRTTSLISMDSTDGNLETIYHLAWKTCPTR